MKLATAFVSGLIFGLGLLVSGLANPSKVQNFLDFAGTWDPSLALVMAGAVVVTAAGYRFASRRGAPLLEPDFHMPPSSAIDGRLVLGSAIFGIGWGLGGLCPGPAVVALTDLGASIMAFAVAMIAGLWGARLLLP